MWEKIGTRGSLWALELNELEQAKGEIIFPASNQLEPSYSPQNCFKILLLLSNLFVDPKASTKCWVTDEMDPMALVCNSWSLQTSSSRSGDMQLLTHFVILMMPY